MSETLQTVIAGGVVVSAALYLILSAVRKKKGGCEKGCGCAPKPPELKK